MAAHRPLADLDDQELLDLWRSHDRQLNYLEAKENAYLAGYADVIEDERRMVGKVRREIKSRGLKTDDDL